MNSYAPGAKAIRACNGLKSKDMMSLSESNNIIPTVFGPEAIKRMGGNPLTQDMIKSSTKSSSAVKIASRLVQGKKEEVSDDEIISGPIKRKKIERPQEYSSDIELEIVG